MTEAGAVPGALDGVRVVVTRARADAEKLVAALERLGATAILLPAIEIRPIPSPELDAVLEGQHVAFDWTLFTSVNTVRIVLDRARELGRDASAARQLGVLAAVGPSTRRALESAGFQVELEPPTATAEVLADELIDRGVDGKVIWIPGSRISRPLLAERLREAGARVTVTPVYDTVCPASAPEDAVAAVREGSTDVVTFTSPSTVRNFLSLGLKPADGTVIASIGPVTTDEAERLGLSVDVTAGEHSAAGLVRALVDHYDRIKSGSESER